MIASVVSRFPEETGANPFAAGVVDALVVVVVDCVEGCPPGV